MLAHEATGVQHRTVAANGDGKVGVVAQRLFGESPGVEIQSQRVRGKHRDPGLRQVPRKSLHGFGDTQVRVPADQRNAFEFGVHGPIVADP